MVFKYLTQWRYWRKPRPAGRIWWTLSTLQ